jgi:Aminotransferase class-III
VRFWLVKTLVASNPLARLSVGSPLYVLYLRALGARIGAGATILTEHVPVCTDLLTIGAGSVIRKDSYLNGYRTVCGVIETGTVTLGAGSFAGEQAILDVGTAVGDGAQLGHASALQAGQAVPAGQRWHGCPAESAGPDDDYLTVPAAGPLDWLSSLAELCRGRGILLIVDDVQMGCGRTGPFFSFESAGLTPDLVCLSKSISGYGLPMALTLIRSDLDIWKPGEHNGTFRGVNPAFITGAAALRAYWQDNALEHAILARGWRIAAALTALTRSLPGPAIRARGRGLAHGLVFSDGELARKVSFAAFERGLHAVC